MKNWEVTMLTEKKLSARHGRLWPGTARRPLARPRPNRRPVRHELRGRRRELRPAWRCRLRGLPVGDRWGAGAQGRPPYEHGVDLRVWQPRRVLASDADIRGTASAADRLRRRHGDAAQSGCRVGHGRGRARDRHPWLALDRLSIHERDGRARPYAPRHRDPDRVDRPPSAWLVSGPVQPQYTAAGGRGRRLPL